MSERIGGKLMVSTDVVGAWGDPRRVVEVYEMPGVGVEAICWNYAMERLKNWNLGNFPIRGLHGPMRLPEVRNKGIRAGILDSLMASPEKIEEISGIYPEAYVLVHEAAAGRWLEKINRVILVENEACSGSMRRTVEKVQEVGSRTANVGFMVDLYHLSKDWNCEGDLGKVVSRLGEVLSAPTKFFGFHFPIGGRAGDNFLIDKVGDGVLRDLGDIFRLEKVKYIVLENQQAGLGMFFLRRKLAQERTMRLVDRLRSLGVF